VGRPFPWHHPDRSPDCRSWADRRLSRFRCARPANIGRYDLLDRFRLDVEVLEARQGPARHVVHPKKINLACGQRRVRQKLEQPRQDLGYREGHRKEQPPPADEAQIPFDRVGLLLLRRHARASAEFKIVIP
jgi:hypothetical protein